MAGSFQNEIPAARINLKLDVGKGDAKKSVELPLKLLVMGDFTGCRKEGRIVDRERVSVDKNNFQQVMADFGLNLSFSVNNRLAGQGEMAVDIPVTGIESFKPESVASSVPALSRLLAARNLLKDLKSNLLDNREFRRRLEELIRDQEKARKLRAELQRIVPELEDKSGLKPI
ncbi:MAG: type VI secretion system contractile sheath small subunit [Chitinispirillia bacterium]|nr:type VI secretion system contractile sheath small subunit [Chitinispirillia bacterium]MCL2269120.1 type VI secretion system contractile sheath small subunit [Chitinispirillia bacterium]